jgi:hypothetical protein
LESGTVGINLAIKNAVRSSEELVGYDHIFAELTALWIFIKREKSESVVTGEVQLCCWHDWTANDTTFFHCNLPGNCPSKGPTI